MHWYRTENGQLVNLSMGQRIFYSYPYGGTCISFPNDGEEANETHGNIVLMREANDIEEAQEFIDKLLNQLHPPETGGKRGAL